MRTSADVLVSLNRPIITQIYAVAKRALDASQDRDLKPANILVTNLSLSTALSNR